MEEPNILSFVLKGDTTMGTPRPAIFDDPNKFTGGGGVAGRGHGIPNPNRGMGRGRGGGPRGSGSGPPSASAAANMDESFAAGMMMPGMMSMQMAQIPGLPPPPPMMMSPGGGESSTSTAAADTTDGNFLPVDMAQFYQWQMAQMAQMGAAFADGGMGFPPMSGMFNGGSAGGGGEKREARDDDGDSSSKKSKR